MHNLTSRERLLRTLRQEDVDRIPVSPRIHDYLSGFVGCDCVQHFIWFYDKCFQHDLMPIYRPPQNNYWLHHTGPYSDLPGVSVEMEIEEIKDSEGGTCEVRRRFNTPAGALSDRRSVGPQGGMVGYDHIIEALIKDRADLEKIRFLLPSPKDAYTGEIPLLREAVGDRGVLTVAATIGVDQFLMDALGVQNALMAYYDDREGLKQLLRIFQDYHRAVLQRVLEQGAEIIFESWFNCSLSAGWSPAQYRELFLPLVKENIELVHSYGAYVDFYDDGKIDAVLGDLTEAGADIIETLPPPPLGDINLESALRRVGDRTCLKGHIDHVNLICFGKPEQIYEAVRQALEVAKRGGRFILGTADSIRRETPAENVKAYFDAAREFRN